MRNRKKEESVIKEQKPSDWIWEFSKRVVVLLTAAYFIVLFYVIVIIAITGKLSCLGILLSETSDVLKTCVFGYFVKAGLENMLKIRHQKRKKEREGEDNDI